MFNNRSDKQIRDTRRARMTYIIIQAAHDFAYFGFITIQPLIIYKILAKFSNNGNPEETNSIAATIFIISLHLIFQFVFETLTGAMADKLGRMVVVFYSFFARAMAVVFLFSAFLVSLWGEPGENVTGLYVLVFVLLVLVQGLMATGEALFTGSIEAWLVDTLKYYESGDEINETFSAAAVIQNIGILIAIPLLLYLYFRATIGGANGNVYFTLSLITVIFLIAAGIALKSRNEVYRSAIEWRNREKVSIKETVNQCVKLIKSSKITLWCMVLISSPFGAWILVSWMWPILLTPSVIKLENTETYDRTFILTIFGLILCIARIGGSWFCQYVQRFVNPLEGLRLALILNLSTLLAGAVIFLIPQNSAFFILERTAPSEPVKIPIGVIVFAASFLIAKALEEIVKIFTQIVLANIITDSTIRATAISFSALLSNLTAFLFINFSVAIARFSSLTRDHKVGLVVGIVSFAGLILAFISSGKLLKSMSFSDSKNPSIENEIIEADFIGEDEQSGEEVK